MTMNLLWLTSRVGQRKKTDDKTNDDDDMRDLNDNKEETESLLTAPHRKQSPKMIIPNSSDSLLRRLCYFCCSCTLLTFVVLSSAFVFVHYKYPGLQWENIICRCLHVSLPPLDTYNTNLTTYKSCVYKRNRWHCQDCGPSGSSCVKLRPVDNSCPGFPTAPLPSATITANNIRTLSFMHHTQEQYDCATVKDCWDLSRCTRLREEQPVLTIYVNISNHNANAVPSWLEQFLDANRIITVKDDNRSVALLRVDHPRDACLIIVTPGMYSSLEDYQSSLSYYFSASNINEKKPAQNHVLWDAPRLHYPDPKTGFRFTSDAPFVNFVTGMASLVSESLTAATIRPNFDLAVPLRRKFARTGIAPDELQLHRPRPHLVSFRGSIRAEGHPYYQYRWLAGTHWEKADDVVVDVNCRRKVFGSAKKMVMISPYQAQDNGKWGGVYSDCLYNSTFGFAPGGSGVGSYRFGEILSMGGIPVVTPEFVPPLAYDWSGCLVTVSPERIIDLPRRLRAMDAKEVESRQRECWRLHNLVFGDVVNEQGEWRSDPTVTFHRAMQVYALRLEQALQMFESA